jgi:peptidylprolyl isomerase
MKAGLLMIAVCGVLAVAGCGESDSSASGANPYYSRGAAERPKPQVPKGPPSQKLIVKDVYKGTGAVVKKGDKVSVHYVAGIYQRGEFIESAWVRDDPFGFQLGSNQVLPAWERGLIGMRVGGRRILIFPTTVKHTPIGSTPKDTLVYVIDMIQIRNRG